MSLCFKIQQQQHSNPQPCKGNSIRKGWVDGAVVPWSSWGGKSGWHWGVRAVCRAPGMLQHRDALLEKDFADTISILLLEELVLTGG